ncbi:type II secretion system F family protein [bacterium]|nr:type II secretion system F family protein [Akkermansiaceae bacterium]MDA7514632.1 type II secretion system F family protein [bacterium]MDA7519115.1 type II secretion system F family protein [Akkermansiaceae bacterium]MDA7863780.1 type II secretion system F family protein [Akkermansiaceae bacterium]MDA8967438.1 type II secretion system F family protein [Akkermansiaceae bacterium]
MSPQQKHLLYTEVAKLIEAGFGINDATETLLDAGQENPVQEVLIELKASLKEGRTIAEAFNEGPMDLLEMEASIIEAGEKGGRLAVSFQQLADYFDLLANSRKEMTRGFIYPAVLFHVAILLSVIPFSLFGGVEKDGVEIMRDFFISLGIAYVILFLLFLGVRHLLKLAPHNATIDRLFGFIPLIGKARKNLALARFTKVYHGGIASGLSMHETLKMAGVSAHSGRISEAVKSLTATLKEGQPLGPVFQQEKVFPKAFARSYLTAEKSGSLDTDLQRWGVVFANEAKSSAALVTLLLPKAFYLLVAGYIGWKIISVYMGYYDGLEDMMKDDY